MVNVQFITLTIENGNCNGNDKDNCNGNDNGNGNGNGNYNSMLIQKCLYLHQQIFQFDHHFLHQTIH